ncbi:beta-N-acetylhexosaminidase [Alkalihalobacillus sp. 1P02AB]|uniref:beta-N-acetylhexosaminidase n=1 Tax=Alkalihalobacillus sp. 1P02AB TaxID=3132260 RepID=UPI0039A67178
MKVNIYGEVSTIEEGLKTIQSRLGLQLSPEGIPIKIQQGKKIEVHFENGRGKIIYDKKVQFFRALGLFLEKVTKENQSVQIEEEAQFETIGPMFDFSRNAVMNVPRLKEMIQTLALMGFDSMMLYMEDTYEVEGEPYFGYMRGRYTEKELRELDDYGHQFGIELIPCIQTLAHLEEFLKWDAAVHLKDTRGALLVEQETTYEFIQKIITAASKPFRSKRIHIGMDEAEELGRGVYLNKFGYRDRFELMNGHLKKVLEVTKALGLEPMMWSDMFIKFASQTGDVHYDLDIKIPEHILEETPKDVQLMYWDYFHTKEEEYDQMIQKHKAFGRTPAFAGGIWVWNTFSTNYGLSLRTSNAALTACKKEGIKDVFVTLWGDDGYENNVFTALLGLQLYAEHAYTKGNVEDEKLAARTEFCTGVNQEDYMLFNALDYLPGIPADNMSQTNPSKFLLWQDVLIGLFDTHVKGIDLKSHFEQLEEKIKSSRNSNRELDYMFDVPEKLSAVLAVKGDLGIRLKQAYDHRDKETLLEIVEKMIPDVIQKVQQLRLAHRSQWLHVNKPFGWEVIDIRYGGLLTRLDTAAMRIEAYLNGQIEKIEELEEERLNFNRNVEESTGVGWSSYYYRMASPNVFFHVLPIY